LNLIPFDSRIFRQSSRMIPRHQMGGK
jgi:hypothetical protein